MPLFDFDKEFAGFMGTNGKSVITEIHGIIPTLSQEQQQIIGTMYYYIKKYDLTELDEFLKSYMNLSKSNKNLNFVRSFNVKNLLKAYTMEEYLKGIRISASQMNEKE